MNNKKKVIPISITRKSDREKKEEESKTYAKIIDRCKHLLPDEDNEDAENNSPQDVA